MKDVSAVCFDVFGTLIHFGGHRVNPYRHLLKSTDERIPLLTKNEGIEFFANQLNLNHLVPVMRRELQNEIDGLMLFDEVEEIVMQLKSRGLKIALCSNLAAEYGPVVKSMLPGLDAYIFSYEAGSVKPEKTIYDAVCQKLKLEPKRILFVGDSKRCDYKGPADYGMKSIWLKRSDDQVINMDLLGLL